MSTNTITGPGRVLFLIEESAAMESRAAESDKTKAVIVANALNALLNQLTNGPSFEVAVIGYQADAAGTVNVGPRLGGTLAGRAFVPLKELASAPIRVETRTRKLPSANPFDPPREEKVQFPVWYEPTLGAKGPQIAAFEFARDQLADWLTRASAAVPMVIHVFTSSSSDGNPHKAMTSLQELKTAGGSPLVFHCHLSSSANVPPTLYPSNRAYLPIGPVRDTFDRASPMPTPLLAALKEAKQSVNTGAHGVVYNGKAVDVIRFFSLVKNQTKGWLATADAPVFQPVAKPMPAPTAPQTQPGTATAPTLAMVPIPFAPETAPAEAPVDVVPAEAPETIPLLSDEPAFEVAVGTDTARLFLLVLDRSVNDPYSGDPQNAFARLQERGNEILASLAKQADTTAEIAVVSYGLDSIGLPEIRNSFDGPLTGRTLVPASELGGGALRVEELQEEVPNGIGGLVTITRKKHVFLDLEPTSQAAPGLAFEAVKELLDQWHQQHQGLAYPPIVLHLTRGQALPTEMAEAAKSLGHARALLYHLVITEQPHKALAYPASADGIEDETLRNLWELSSMLWKAAELAATKPSVSPDARGFVVNGKFDLLQ